MLSTEAFSPRGMRITLAVAFRELLTGCKKHGQAFDLSNIGPDIIAYIPFWGFFSSAKSREFYWVRVGILKQSRVIEKPR